ncbi:MAG: hypothetical protein L0229_31790 [Blastocatellia bacterium]|nr:hypothetical protein [Blastocatellia bacterium]
MSWHKHHSESERFASEAEISARQGDTARASELYLLAAEAEMRALREIDPKKTRTLGVTAVSSAALYYKAGEYQMAQTIAEEWLDKGNIPPFAVYQLSNILQTLRAENLIGSTTG